MNLKIFQNRWWVVVGSFLGLVVSAAPVATNTIGTFIKPISSDLGWTRSQVTLGLAISGFTMAIGSIILGRLMDRYGIRPVTLASVVGFGISMAAIGFTPRSLAVFTILKPDSDDRRRAFKTSSRPIGRRNIHRQRHLNNAFNPRP